MVGIDFSGGSSPSSRAERPCFLSRAQQAEFELLVDHVRRSIHACGPNHALVVVKDLAGLSHDPDAVMRCALADLP